MKKTYRLFTGDAEEKAKELFNKYCYAIRTEETESGYFANVKYAKDCALIAVEEILKANPSHIDIDDRSGHERHLDNEDYWFDVKKELLKLK